MMSRSFEKYVELAGTSYSLLDYRSKKTPVITAEMKFADNQSIDTCQFTLSKTSPDRLAILRKMFSDTEKEKKNLPYQVVIEPNFKESALVGNKDRVAQSIYKMLSFCKVYQFHDSFAEGPLRQTCPMETANYLQSYGNNLPSFLLHLKKYFNDSYTRIVNYVREVIPQFQYFYLEPTGNNISLKWTDKFD